jgi:hypothetical protein
MDPLSLAATYDDIRLNTNRNRALAAKADTIYRLANDAITFMDRIKSTLIAEDKGGGTTIAATRLLDRTKTVDSLRTKLMGLAAVDSALHLDPMIRTDSNWSMRYFRNTPTVAVVTILAKFESDCRKSALKTLTVIDHQL